jgi:hypothetical protein
VRANVLQQHRVLLRHPGPLPHPLPAARRVPPAAPPPATARCSSHCLNAGARSLLSSGNCSGKALCRRRARSPYGASPLGQAGGASGARGATESVR